MPGILYVVATPIGNLEDVTLRALRVLREVSLIAAEDTRRTARLLQHYSITTPTTSLHEHNERTKTPALVERLRRGESIALVSDAGTPLLSDPGTLLVSGAHQAGIKVEPIPGPSAAVSVLSASGAKTQGFVFAGFPPSRSIARKTWLRQFLTEPRAVVFFEAPHRIRRFLDDLRDLFGDRVLTLGRELTKAHEELVVRPISEHIDHLREPKGEYTILLHPAEHQLEQPSACPLGSELTVEFGELTNKQGLTRRQALQNLAAKYRVPSRHVYALLERAKE
jgi:16S rRNA (cytidine1402-2'-O)-methyltransferase